MTREMKFKIALEKYDAQKHFIDEQYREGMDRVSVNEAAEVNMNEVLELNMWYTEETNKAQKKLWESIQGGEA